MLVDVENGRRELRRQRENGVDGASGEGEVGLSACTGIFVLPIHFVKTELSRSRF